MIVTNAFGDDVTFGDGGKLTCPYCRGENLHVSSVFNGGDGEVTDRPRGPTGKYGTYRITMWCECCGERPVLSVIDHKGEVFLALKKWSGR